MSIKLTKEKEVIKEEVEIKNGLYFFSIGYKGDEPYEFCKINITSEAYGRHEGFAQIDWEFVRNDYDDYFIRKKSGYDDFLPYDFNRFFLQDSAEKEYKEITEQEFEQQKQEVIKRIA